MEFPQKPLRIAVLCCHFRRERRTKFEAHLMSERKKIEVFRLRETKEFLSIDELREKCDTSDQFMDILKVSLYTIRSNTNRNSFNDIIAFNEISKLRI